MSIREHFSPPFLFVIIWVQHARWLKQLFFVLISRIAIKENAAKFTKLSARICGEPVRWNECIYYCTTTPFYHLYVLPLYHHSTFGMHKMCNGTTYTVEQGKNMDRKWSRKRPHRTKMRHFLSPFKLEFWINNAPYVIDKTLR